MRWWEKEQHLYCLQIYKCYPLVSYFSSTFRAESLPKLQDQGNFFLNDRYIFEWVCHNLKWKGKKTPHTTDTILLTLQGDVFLPYIVDPGNRTAWITEKVNLAKTQFLDGINIDIEHAVEAGSAEYHALTGLVKESTEAFHREIPGSQVSGQNSFLYLIVSF